jgi:predicted acylesterase/phospholipase RssA
MSIGRFLFGSSLVAALGLFALGALVVLDAEPLPILELPVNTEAGGTTPPRAEQAVQSSMPFVEPESTCTRILAIDGGGIRGLAPAIILARLEELTGKPISELFDLVAGTSTGAILALGLTRPSDADAEKPAFSAAELVTLYERHGPGIFPSSGSWLTSLRQLLGPKYPQRGVAKVLDEYFSDVRLVEALTSVLVPAYDINNHERIWFSSEEEWARDVMMRDLVRGATAAPTYLPPSRFVVPDMISKKHYVVVSVDGALFANNPAVEALAYADQKKRWDNDHDDRSVLMVSIGTGKVGQGYSFEAAWRWGLVGWVRPLLEIAFNDPGIQRVAKALVSQRGTYFRLQVESEIALDDASPASIRKLKETTDEFLKLQNEQLVEIAHKLSLERPKRCGFTIGANYVRPFGPRGKTQ